MILLTRINGEAFALNPDLIERVEETPDTHITLVDGKHLMVAESLKEVIDAVRAARPKDHLYPYRQSETCPDPRANFTQ